jgi:hypothetical protein
MSRICRARHRRIAGNGKRRVQKEALLAKIKARTRKLDREIVEIQTRLLGSVVLAHARENTAFREELQKAILATVPDPQDRAALPELSPPADATLH